MDQEDNKQQASARSFRNRLWIGKTNKTLELKTQILQSRNIVNPTSFFNPKIMDTMPDPSGLIDIDSIVEIISNSQCVGLFGDYDVDGIASVAMWQKALAQIGIDTVVYLPNRSDGYGVSRVGLDKLLSMNVDLILFLDCGTSSASLINELPVKTAIIDHHQTDLVANANACVNPHRKCAFGQNEYMNLCTGGLSFLIIARLSKYYPILNPMLFLDLVALTNLADVVKLTPFNRACVRYGMNLINKGSNSGLSILIDLLKLKLPITSTSLGFYIIPTLNAAGRINDVNLSLQLLVSTNPEVSRSIANQLISINKYRKLLTKEALDMAKSSINLTLPSLVIKHESFHPGLVGIIAGQLKESYSKTSLVFYKKGSLWYGSARSASPHCNIGQLILKSVHLGLAVHGGGHSAAAGVAVTDEKFLQWENWILQEIAFLPQIVDSIRIDAVISELTITKMPDFYEFGPFGNGNPSLHLLLNGVWLRELICYDNYFKCILHSGQTILGFRLVDGFIKALRESVGKVIDLVLSVDESGGYNIEDARMHF